jgi:hypothetical protein
MASRLNSDSSNGLQLISDSSGEIQVQANGITKAQVTSDGLINQDNILVSNRPIFTFTNSGSTQSVSNGVKTKVTLDTSVVDTNNAIDTANSKIVIPSGMGGIYSINYALRMDGNSSSQLGIAIAYLELNGSEYNRVYQNQNSNLGRAFHCTRTTVMSLNEGDELELYGQANTSGGTQFLNYSIQYTELSGFKLLG